MLTYRLTRDFEAVFVLIKAHEADDAGASANESNEEQGKNCQEAPSKLICQHALDTPTLLNHVLRIVEAKQYTYSSHKQLISAVALFLKEVHRRSVDFSPVYPTRRPQPLPEILSVREVKAILAASSNLKHRTMLTLVYAQSL